MLGGRNGEAWQFNFIMEAKSVITFPSGGQGLPGPGFYEIRRLAWLGRGLVRRDTVPDSSQFGDSAQIMSSDGPHPARRREPDGSCRQSTAPDGDPEGQGITAGGIV
jgi:hypothetical protein